MSGKILITGANGFIGRCILALLQSTDYEIHAVSTTEHKSDRVQWHRLNLFDQDGTAQLINNMKFDYLLHLAWETTPGKYIEAPENLDWVSASLALCKAFYQSGGRRAVFAGTCFEYDLTSGVLREDSPTMPSSLYGTCKLSLYNIISRYCEEQKLSYSWGRIFYLFGPSENENRVIPYVIRSLLSGKEALCSEGLVKRDYLYVEDVAAAFVHLLKINQNGVFNIGSGKTVSLRDILNKVAVFIGRSDLLKLGVCESRPEPQIIQADSSKLNKTGFEPIYSLNTELEKTIEWWKMRINEY